MAFYSTPGHFYFADRIRRWIKRQDQRLYFMIPFWDSLGVAFVNEAKAEDIRIITRAGQVDKYLRQDIQVRTDPDIHSKIIIGDHATLVGSTNMTYQSLFDNQENAAYSRANAYVVFFLEKWEMLQA